MKIQVWKRYSGKRAKRPIETGEYNENNGKLFGLARYLIDNGNAREIEEEVAPDKPVAKRAAKAKDES